MIKTGWARVTKRNPCPICGKKRYCSVSADGKIAFCMSIISDKPIETKIGVGYIHRLSGELQAVAKRMIRKPAARKRRCEACALLSRKAQDAVIMAELVDLARILGVTTESLRRLHIGWYDERYEGRHYTGWSFPMRDKWGNVVGMRVRNGRSKFSAPGFTEGLFIPDGIPESGGRLYITEGPTDCAAMLDLGGYCIGRPNCHGGVTDLIKWCWGREVIIIADRDEDRKQGIRRVNPGWDGAVALAEAIKEKAGIVWLMKPVGAKDLREWKRKNPKLNEAAIYAVATAKGKYQ